jgi:hypothetical protein
VVVVLISVIKVFQAVTEAAATGKAVRAIRKVAEETVPL